jgi:Protein of unknown function (DUF3040)
VPDNDESRAFARIVSQLRREDPRFAAGETDSARRRSHTLLLIGIVLCAAAILLIAFGGPKGAVIAIAPWLAGLIAVIRSRSGK